MKEIKKFKIGDKVICIDDRPMKFNPPPLIYKKEYIIKDIFQCNYCGEIAIDVGLVTSNSSFTTCDCDKLLPGKGIHWCNPRRFEKAIEDLKENEEFVEMKFETKKLIHQPISLSTFQQN